VLSRSFTHHVKAHAINFTAGESWDEFYKKRRSGKTRRRLKEKRNALNKLGDVKFRLAQTPAEAEAIVTTCVRLKSEQLRGLGHWDPFSGHGIPDFLSDYFSKQIGQESWAASLDLNGQPIAAAFGFRDESDWLLYQMAMSGQGTTTSPGTHLLIHLMQHFIELGVKRLDLSLGDESYKAEWCDETTTLKTTTIPLTLRGSALCALIGLRGALQTWLASNPRLYERGKYLRGVIRKAGIPV
jgi:CelD/BcsL family acetyltransferase involved in cellulose biosynthesis